MAPAPPHRRWDIFCRVIDNYGDLGVCWRLAADLVQRGQSVRLWVDDAALAARMAQAEAGVHWVHWTEPAPLHAPGDVVVEAFGCDPPDTFVQAMAGGLQKSDRQSDPQSAPPAPVHTPAPPLWINLEYLTAEPYAARSHGLPSPQYSGPGRGLTKWFYYPGFTPDTGGLLREDNLQERQAAFDRHAWLAQWGPALRADEQVVSLFAYPQAPVEALLSAWHQARTLGDAAQGQAFTVTATHTPAVSPAHRRIRLMVTHGPLQARVAQWQEQQPDSADWLTVVNLPWLSQDDFDHLLWASDLNLVRGEDSLVRALWAGRPFVWQLYPQHDGAHAAKLEAFAQAMALAGCGLPQDVLTLWRAWNGLIPWPRDPAVAWLPWQTGALAFCQHLLKQAPLGSQLLAFVDAHATASRVG